MKPKFFVVIVGVLFVAALVLRSQTTSEKLRKWADDLEAITNGTLPAPLPEPPAHALVTGRVYPKALPQPLKQWVMEHPSGMRIEIIMPTNQLIITIPTGYVLTNKAIKDVTLDQFQEFKRTNSQAVLFYFEKQAPPSNE